MSSELVRDIINTHCRSCKRETAHVLIIEDQMPQNIQCISCGCYRNLVKYRKSE